MQNILQVKDLHTHFYTDTGPIAVLEGVSFSVAKGQVLALVGESGCGKTVTALSIMRLIDYLCARIVKGQVLFAGQDLVQTPLAQMRKIRGKGMGMVFQEPMSALNPLYTIGYQIGETILAHNSRAKQGIRERVIELLKQVEMPQPNTRFSDYPHSLSGGLRQRAMIAQAIACGPALLIADEPTTALDVTIQAQILKLFIQLKKTRDLAILLITHDLGVVAQVADRVCVMYAGKIVEDADVFAIFDRPQHPYTQKLLRSFSDRVEYGKRP